MNISIIGTGYVGLVTGACLADRGHTVTCVDLDPARVAALNRAEAPFFEAGLPVLLQRTVGKGLSATIDLPAAIAATDITFIAVGTPFSGTEIDLTWVLAAARQVGEALRLKAAFHAVVMKSTVVPGTTDRFVKPEIEKASGKKAGVDFGIGMNPEFLSEGEAVSDFSNPDRIVLGGLDPRTIEYLEEVYRPFPNAPVIRTNTRTAEMIKYASNALLANLISFSNELANLGAAIGEIDAEDVMLGVRMSQYFQTRNSQGQPPITSFLRAGCGFGGSCLPKDVKALIAHGKNATQTMQLLQAVIDVNESQPSQVIQLLKKHWPRVVGLRVAVLGLAFKPGTSDVRESPAFPLIRKLLQEEAIISVHDPVAQVEARHVLGKAKVAYEDSMEKAIAGADAVIVVTPWPEFAALPSLISAQPRPPLLVDTRRTFKKTAVARYEGIGLG
jgi:UDPglucose 6-dehydrogenase/GDP-mannose 6-dehydrogenase